MAFITLEDMSGRIECLLFPKVYELIASELRVEAPFYVYGRISFHEDEAAKIVADRASLLTSGTDIIPKMPTSGTNSSRAFSFFAAKSSDIEKSATKQAENKNMGMRKGLYLKVPSKASEQFKWAMKLLSVFDGNTPVYFYFEDEKSLKCAPKGSWADINPVLISELENRLGKEFVKTVL